MKSSTVCGCVILLLLLAGVQALGATDSPKADLQKMAGQLATGKNVRWKYLEAVVEWGFGQGAETLSLDGRFESTFNYGMIGKIKPLADDPATTVTGDTSWKSPASDRRRGIVTPILYTDAPLGPEQTIITVSTSAGRFSFRPIDLESGPILAVECGFFVANALSHITAKQFQKDLAAKNVKTIRERVRQRGEQTFEDAIRAVNTVKTLPAFPKPAYEPAMSLEVPDQYLTSLWRIGAWRIIKNCPRINRADIKKVGQAQLFARQVREHCEIVDDKDPRGVYVIPDHPFASLGCETDRVIWALDQMGMHAVVRDGISVWLENQQKDGCLTLGSDIDTRQHRFGALNILWVIIEHYRLTGDKAWLKQEMPRLQAAAQWIIDRRKTTMRENLSPKEVEGSKAGTWPPYGLQPKIAMGDGDPAGTRCYLVNDAFAYRSILMCGEALAEIDSTAGSQLLAEAASYRKDILKVLEETIALSPVMKVRDGTYRSFLPQGFQDHGARSRVAPQGTNVYGHCGIFSSDIVGPSAAIEAWLNSRLLSIDDPRIDGHFDVLEDVFLSDNPWLRKRKRDYDPEKDWFGNGGWGYQAGWERVPEYYLMKDDVANFIRSVMNHCAVDLNLANGKYTFNEHTTFADNDKSFENAIFLSNLRNMLLYEVGDTLWLAKATPRAWLEQGKRIAVKNAPSHFGTLACEIVSDADHGKIKATVTLPSRKPARVVVLRLRHPRAAPITSVSVGGKSWTDFDARKETIRLHDVTGTIVVEAGYAAR